MWVMVFFDLPVVKKEQQRAANKFRLFLLKDGYIMLQFSVYARVCGSPDSAEKHILRVKKNLPKEGSIRALQVTDKQYSRMEILLGTIPPEEATGSRQLLLF